jgi:hypothetical protein
MISFEKLRRLSKANQPKKLASMNEWIDVIDKPQKSHFYRMLTLMTDDGKTYTGWWTGQNFDGLNIRGSTKVIKWRLAKDS